METKTYTKDKANPQMEMPDLNIEELEAVIAPAMNHNETVTTQLGLDVEALEPIIAPGSRFNHNEVLAPVGVEMEIEELEEIIAPGVGINHNEAFGALV